MQLRKEPAQNGLYRPEFEHDACGIGALAHLKGVRSHQMIDDALAYRKDYHELPPKVEYGLTELGKEMLPIIDALAEFGTYYKSVLSGNK